MLVETNQQGVKVQFDRRKPAQIVSWEELPQFIGLLNNVARQRVVDLRNSAKSINALAKEMEKAVAEAAENKAA